MKKYFPIFVPVSVVIITLCIFFFNSFKIEAVNSNPEANKHAHYISQLPKVVGKTYTGEVVDASKEKKQIVVLNFWASWCNPCVQEFASLNKFIDNYKGKIFVVGINADEEDPVKDIERIHKRYKLQFPTIIDYKNKISEKFGVELLPFSIVFCHDKVLWVSNKKMDYQGEEFLKSIDEELAKH